MSRCFLLVVAIAGLVICSGSSRAQPAVDRESYYPAVEYCRGDVPRPMALSPDGWVLCFDGGRRERHRQFPGKGASMREGCLSFEVLAETRLRQWSFRI